MGDSSLRKLGGSCSILLGITYIVIGVNYLLLPAAQRPGAPGAQFLASLAQDPTQYKLQFWMFALGAIFALAAVQAISDAVRSGGEGWVRWTGAMALLGFAVTAVNAFRLLAIQPLRATAYVAGDASTKSIIEGTGALLPLDPQGWLAWGGIGLWVLAVSLIALRGVALPRNLAYVGIVTAILYWFVLAGLAFQVERLVAIAAGLGGVIAAPIWYVWTGIILRRG